MVVLKQLIASGVMATAIVLGTVGPVNAADLIRSWEAIEADKSGESKYGGGHAFWLPEMVNGGKFIFDSDAVLNEYDDGTAHFFGSVVAANDINKKWDFDIWFETTNEGSGGPKKELHGSAYLENGGTIDTETWTYYDFSSTKASVLTADAGTYAGQSLSLADYTGGKFPMQIGLGASGKNLEMGFSTWFSYDGNQTSTRHADINVNLISREVSSTPVPEPSVGLLALGIAGVAARGLKRKR